MPAERSNRTVKVVVVGLGYIGLPTAAMLALHGAHVVGVDVRRDVLDALRSENVPAREKDLTAVVRDALRSRNLTVASKPERADFYVICVPTPLLDRRADLSALKAATRSVANYLRPGCTVIVESTVPPGTTGGIVRALLEKSGLSAGVDFHLAYCPERVMPGSIMKEIVENDRVIGGIDHESATAAQTLYSTFVRGTIHLTDLATAEFVKLAENAYRDVNIALANELSDLAEEHGVDAWKAIGLANLHPRVKFLHPGPGVGGHCIAVDPWFLLTPKAKSRLIPISRQINDGRPRLVVESVLDLLRNVNTPKVAVFGVAYKGNSDDVRESPALKVIDGLRSRGVRVEVFDPLVPHDRYPTLQLEGAIDGADCILLLTDHREFYYIDPSLLAGMVRRPILVDTRNCVDHEKWRKSGFEIHLLGSNLRPMRQSRLAKSRLVTPEATPGVSERVSPRHVRKRGA